MDDQTQQSMMMMPQLAEAGSNGGSPMSSDYGEEDMGMTASRYARNNHLTMDYRTYDPITIVNLLNLGATFEMSDDSRLFLDVQNIDRIFREKPQIDRQGALFLQEICQPPTISSNIEELFTSGETGSVKHLPLPLLQSDNELDMAFFSKRRRDGRPDPSQHFGQFQSLTPMETVESFEEELWNHSEGEKAFKEKLEVPRDAMAILQEIVQKPVLPEDLGQLERNKVVKIKPISPILLPRERPLTLPLPTSSALELDEWSMPSDLTSLEMNELLGGNDPKETVLPSSSTFQSHLDVAIAPSSEILMSDISFSRKRSILKIEVPLLPGDSGERMSKRQKTVCFTTAVPEIIPEDFRRQISPLEAHTSSQELLEDLFAQFVNTAEEVEAGLRNEQLEELDAILRPTVPSLPLYEPSRPWNTAGAGPAVVANILSYTAPDSEGFNHLVERLNWIDGTRIERKLPWNPFGQGPNLESLEDMLEEVQPYLDALSLDATDEGLVESSSLLYKQPGLRLLDELEQEENELELASPPLIVGRQRLNGDKPSRITITPARILSTTPNSRGQITKATMTAIFRSPKSASEPTSGSQAFRRASGPSISPLSSGAGLIGTQLPNFFMTRALSQSQPSKHQRQARIPVEPKLSDTLPSISPGDETFSDVVEDRRKDRAKAMSGHDRRPATVMVASSLHSSHRSMLRSLKSWWPRLTMIDRDFTNSDPILATEADMPISASTGLILTTMQKIKQKPLPGQSSRNLIRDRLMAIGQRYEMVIVLVSEAAAAPMPYQMLDERDTAALNDLTMFSGTVGAQVRVIYVPDGSDGLAQEVIHCIETHHIEHDAHKILQEETHWERLLRKHGLNVFAAQLMPRDRMRSPSVIKDHADELSPEDESSLHDSGEYSASGLRQFMTMSAEERISRFAGLMGGTRILHRVNAVLEQTWHSHEESGYSSSLGAEPSLNNRKLNIHTSDF